MRLLTLIFLFFNQSIYGSFEMNENMRQSYFHIINLEFEKANMFIENEKLKNPKNGFITLHENYIDFLTIFITEDQNYFKSHEKYKNERLHLIEENDKKSPYYLYAKAEIILQWAFSRLKFEQYPTAIYELIKAYKLLEKNQVLFPDFTLNNKGLGLIHALLGAVPKDFHWLLDLAGFEGSLTLGVSELETVLNDTLFFMYEDEVLFFISFLQLKLGHDNLMSQNYLDKIGDRYQNNLLLSFAAARLAHSLGQNDYCLKILNERPKNSDVLKFYYLDYLEGMCYLYMLDLAKATQKIQYFLENFAGQNFIKSAYHKLALISFLEKNIIQQQIYFDRVLSYGKNLVEADKIALKQVKSNVGNHTILLRTGLLYDGGYYSLALSEIKKIKENRLDIFSTIHQIEYWYRMAQIKYKLNQDKEVAIKYYKKVLQLKRDKIFSNYYVPMSALQIALIYENKKNFHNAKLYFNKCLLMSDFDYERAIHQKAKLGLARISN